MNTDELICRICLKVVAMKKGRCSGAFVLTVSAYQWRAVRGSKASTASPVKNVFFFLFFND